MNTMILKMIPVLLAFFIMGFVDIVGVSTSYVKQDFELNDTLANLLPMLVFIWFAICSLPTSLLMGRIGRKRTVLCSLGITCISMLIPLMYYSFATVLFAFTLLGIGNTVLQVSLNPLLLNVVAKDKVTSVLTLGQFIKAISSTLGPVIASAMVGIWGNWHLIFVVYAVTSFLSCLWLAMTPITEMPKAQSAQHIGTILSLFRNPKLMIAFSVILLIVGFEIGLMTAVPKYFSEQCNLPIEKGSLGCSLYFAARTLGTFLGTIILARYSSGRFLTWNMVLAIAMFAIFMWVSDTTVLLTALFLIGLSCANVFPIIFSLAIQSEPDKANEISALMIMGVAGGAILPMIMGLVADHSSQLVSLLIPFAALIYILIVSIRQNKNT
ncbi:MAG: MFS transporter [Parabacteroides sp.]